MWFTNWKWRITMPNAANNNVNKDRIMTIKLQKMVPTEYIDFNILPFISYLLCSFLVSPTWCAFPCIHANSKPAYLWSYARSFPARRKEVIFLIIVVTRIDFLCITSIEGHKFTIDQTNEWQYTYDHDSNKIQLEHIRVQRKSTESRRINWNTII